MHKSLLKAFLALLLPISGYSQADKLLEPFNNTALIYSAFNPAGAGSSQGISVDNTAGNFQEGTSSIRFDYTFNALAGGFLEGFRSYGMNTLDLSYAPDGLTLKVKGSAGIIDKISVMLYEDLDMDGVMGESGEEIYESSQYNITSSWSQLHITNFVFITSNGSGNNQLDLNRIYAWRIKIINTSGTAHSSSVWIDDLRQTTTYTPFTSGTALLTGSFIQLWNTAGCSCGQWTQTQWNDELQKMKDAGLNKIIVQYGVWETNAWYNTGMSGYADNPTLDRIFAAAEAKGIKVIIGLYFKESWNSADKTLSTTYSDILTVDQTVIDELWSLYGASSAFEGWYIPQEINDLEWRNGSAQQTLLFNWLKSVSDYAKGKSSTKKVYIAPFFGPNRPANDLQNWYTALLTTATNIDVVIPQDGVGTTRVDGDVDVPHYFNAIKTAVTAQGKIFGATLESFHQTDGWPVNGNAFAAVPASVTTFKSQLWEAGAYATELYQFEYPYMQGNRGAVYQQLYDEYIDYYDAVTAATPTIEKTSGTLLLYPVPSSGKVSLVLPVTVNNAEVIVYNASGNKVMVATINDNVYELNLSSKGIYMVTVITTEQIRYIGKIVVQE